MKDRSRSTNSRARDAAAPACAEGPAREAPSPWIERFAPLVEPGGRVLDLACGAGRHTRFFADRGNPVTAVDRDVSRLEDLARHGLVEALAFDLEAGEQLPFARRRFAAVVVTRYLHRPLLGSLVDAVAPGGLFLYETFAAGNERFGKPARPEFLLQPGELLDVVRGRLRVLAYEDLIEIEPRPAAIQRIAAVRKAEASG